MTDAQFGISRLILINSGRYGFAEVNLQKPVHLAAGNNQGKTTLVNAMQFLYINELSNMKFPNTDDETAKHYFGSSNSYLVFECATPTGVKTILLRGLTKLQSGRYERYSYDGKFIREDFVDDQGYVRSFEDVQTRMADRHFTKIPNNALWRVLSGHASQRGDTSGGVKILPVKDEEAYRDFCRVYKKLLTLADLDSSALRDLIISCHSRSIGAKKIDIATDYSDEFERAERLEQEFGFISAVRDRVKQGIEARQIVVDLTAKLKEVVPSVWKKALLVNSQIAKSRSDCDLRLSSLETEITQLSKEREKFLESKGKAAGDLKRSEDELANLQQEYEQTWSGYTDSFLSTMEETRRTLNQQIGELEKTLSSVEKFGPAALQLAYDQKRRDLEKDRRTLENWEQTFGTFLVNNGFSADELDVLFRLINVSAFGAIVGDEIKITNESLVLRQCHDLLSNSKGMKYSTDSLAVDLGDFKSISLNELDSRDGLAERIEIAAQDLSDTKRRLEVATNQQLKQAELVDFRARLSELDSELVGYSHFISRWTRKSEYEQLVGTNEGALKAVEDNIEELDTRLAKLDTEKQSVDAHRTGCLNQRNKIKDAFDPLNHALTNLGLDTQIIPNASDAETNETTDADQPAVMELKELADAVEQVDASAGVLARDAKAVSDADTNVIDAEKEIKQISRQHVGQELYFENRDDEWLELSEKVASLDEMRAAVDKAWDVLFKTLSGRLDGILQGISEVKKAVRRITAGLKTYQVSNLQGVELRVETDATIFPTIEEICRKDGLFQDRDEIENAKKRLRTWITNAKVLTIDSMFSLKIAGAESDGTPIYASSLDKIGSTGTGITIKAMILCQLIRALVTNENYHLHFFIDETGRLDDPNLSATVKMAVSQSIIPITAEPKVKLESLAHPEVMIYTLGTTEDDKFKIDSQRSFRARRVNDQLAPPTKQTPARNNVSS